MWESLGLYSRQTSAEAGLRVISGLFGFSGREQKFLFQELDSEEVLSPAPVPPTNIPNVGVQAHVSGGFLELEAGVGGRQLPVVIRMPRQAADGSLHLVRISEVKQLMKQLEEEPAKR